MAFTVEIFDGLETRVAVTHLVLRPTLFALSAVGGPEMAEIEATGAPDALWQVTNWLQHRVHIRNEQGTLVWWGYIESAGVGRGAVRINRTLQGVVNRLQVAHTYEAEDGSQVRYTTAWAQHAESVATYGRFEARLSLADADTAEAEAYGDTVLAQRARPYARMEIADDDGTALLVCKGWWSTLERQFYGDARGLVEHKVNSDLVHVLAWQLTSQTTIGFNDDRLDDLSARLAQVRPNNELRVAGSTSNDGLYHVASAGDAADTAITYVSSAIQIERFDDVVDGDNGLGFAKLGFMIHIAGVGQTENSGAFWVTKESVNRLEVTPATMVDENGLGAVTVKQGHGLTIEEEFVQEKSGASITVYHGSYKVAQRFRITSADWTLREVRVQAAKVGTPVDNLRCRIFWGDATAPSGQLLSAELTAAQVGTEMAWRVFDFGVGTTLTAGGHYWIVVDRTGATHYENFWLVGLESAATYAYGMKVQDGFVGGYQARDPDAHMPFRAYGRTDTTEQLGDMLADAQWLTGVEVDTTSGIEVNPYRDGEQTLATEVERLIAMGTGAAARLVVRVRPDRSAVIESVAQSGHLNTRLMADGTLQSAHGQPLQPGVLPVGEWVTVDGIPSSLSEAATFYVARAEYDVETGRVRLEPWEPSDD